MWYHFGKLKGWLLCCWCGKIPKVFNQWEKSIWKLASGGVITFESCPLWKKCFYKKVYFFQDIFGSKEKFLEWGPQGPFNFFIFWNRPSRENCQKGNTHYFSILMGVYFLHFLPKAAVSAPNFNFLPKCQFSAKFGSFTVNVQFEILTAVFGRKCRKKTPIKIEK